MAFRIEKKTLWARSSEVPADKYWAAQTGRSGTTSKLVRQPAYAAQKY